MRLISKISIFTAVLAFNFSGAKAQEKPANVLDLKYSIEDSEIVYPPSYETDTEKLLERWYLKNYTTSTLPSNGADTHPSAAVIRERLANLPTVIDMPYNQIVHSYIERYTVNGRQQVSALLGLCSYYMPIFEQALEEAGLPLELKYLPVIESSLNPNAVSKSGAAGLWQFILASAKGYDMEVNSLIDERRDPYISSNRACRFLKELYSTYGDWSLVIAAYNCGPGTVNKALARAGGDPKTHDFWSIYYLLPEQTRGYVPMFIAANYVMTYYPEHNIAPVLLTKPLVTDTVHISDRLHFNQISEVLKIPVEEIRILNPQFRADIIPATVSRPCNLILPSQQIHAFLVSEEQIYAYDRDKYARKIDATPGDDPGVQAVEETVAQEVIPEPVVSEDISAAEMMAETEDRAAETEYREVAMITSDPTTPRRRRHNAQETAQTQTQTQQPARTQQAEQVAPAKKTEEQKAKTNTASVSASKNDKKANGKTNTSAKNNASSKKTASKSSEHTIAKGENLTVVAKKYGVTVQELRDANPTVKNDLIKAGDKIKIPAPKSKKSGGKKKRR